RSTARAVSWPVLPGGPARCADRRCPWPERDHQRGSASAIGGEVSLQPVAGLPPNSATVAQRLASSPRHGEWATIKTGPNDSVRAWVVYPQRSTKAPVVVVIHEIFGLSTWVRGIADQLAADGFI